MAFIVIPLYVFGLSMAHKTVLYIGVIIPLLSVGFAIIVNVLQEYKPYWLPEKMQDWTFLPLWLHSLKPYDKYVKIIINQVLKRLILTFF